MSKPGKILLLLGLLLVISLILAWKPLSRFLFHPEGLSLAASELCVVNKSGLDLIVEIDVAEGAKSITLLGTGEKGCSAAPRIDLLGSVSVSEKEGQPPFCKGRFAVGKDVEVQLFSPENNCGWKS